MKCDKCSHNTHKFSNTVNISFYNRLSLLYVKVWTSNIGNLYSVLNYVRVRVEALVHQGSVVSKAFSLSDIHIGKSKIQKKVAHCMNKQANFFNQERAIIHKNEYLYRKI